MTARRSLPLLLIAAILSMAALPAHTQERVVVPTRVIYPGETVATDSLEEVPLRRHLKNPAAILMRVGQVDGKVARRTLLPGRMIPVGSVREAHLVEVGKQVQALFVHGGLQIAVGAVPLQAGGAGDLVRLRNVDTGAVFSGVVMDDGTVRVTAS